jgi:hypothetical protein
MLPNAAILSLPLRVRLASPTAALLDRYGYGRTGCDRLIVIPFLDSVINPSQDILSNPLTQFKLTQFKLNRRYRTTSRQCPGMSRQ